MIYEIYDLNEIKYTLESILEVPDPRLSPLIIEKIMKYIEDKFSVPDYKIAMYISKKDSNNNEIIGFVIVQIDPSYKSYGKSCPTFGWLRAKSKEACTELLLKCENFAVKNGYRKLRGPINNPKGLGGIGAQIEGNNERLMYGVAFNPPKIGQYLSELGYKQEAEYICARVTAKTWKKGKKIDKGIRIGYLPLDEIIVRKTEIMKIVASSFNFILPDYSGGDRFQEVMDQYAMVPKSHYKLPAEFNPEMFSDIPEFIEAWKSCDLENVITWAPIAFDRNTDEIVGAIFSLPDLYQLWLGERITRDNVDTVFVKPGYTSKGIFSALNNIGQITVGFNGLNYLEGTCIWNKNEKAVQSVFPHTKPLRKHIVFQKRLRNKR